jgi:hypothetical protein
MSMDQYNKSKWKYIKLSKMTGGSAPFDIDDYIINIDTYSKLTEDELCDEIINVIKSLKNDYTSLSKYDGKYKNIIICAIKKIYEVGKKNKLNILTEIIKQIDKESYLYDIFLEILWNKVRKQNLDDSMRNINIDELKNNEKDSIIDLALVESNNQIIKNRLTTLFEPIQDRCHIESIKLFKNSDVKIGSVISFTETKNIINNNDTSIKIIQSIDTNNNDHNNKCQLALVFKINHGDKINPDNKFFNRYYCSDKKRKRSHRLLITYYNDNIYIGMHIQAREINKNYAIGYLREKIDIFKQEYKNEHNEELHDNVNILIIGDSNGLFSNLDNYNKKFSKKYTKHFRRLTDSNLKFINKFQILESDIYTGFGAVDSEDGAKGIDNIMHKGMELEGKPKELEYIDPLEKQLNDKTKYGDITLEDFSEFLKLYGIEKNDSNKDNGFFGLSDHKRLIIYDKNNIQYIIASTLGASKAYDTIKYRIQLSNLVKITQFLKKILDMEETEFDKFIDEIKHIYLNDGVLLEKSEEKESV